MSATEAQIGNERIVTMRELSQNTSGVIDEILESGRPAFLTRRGQFIAMIKPLEAGAVERAVLTGLLRQLDTGGDDSGADSTDFVAAMNGINRESL